MTLTDCKRCGEHADELAYHSLDAAFRAQTDCTLDFSTDSCCDVMEQPCVLWAVLCGPLCCQHNINLRVIVLSSAASP